jgi:hypothetical protein
MDSKNPLSQEDRFNYQALLDEAIEAITSADAQLGPGKHKSKANSDAMIASLRKLKEAQALFAPTLTVQRLRKRDFTARDLEPSPEVLKWMDSHRFYLVQIPVTLMPIFGWSFVRLRCWIGFKAGSNKEDPPKAHDIYPENSWAEILKLQPHLNLGLDESLRFWAGLEQSEISYQALSGKAQARIGIAAEGGAKLVIGPFNYSVQRAEVLSTGLENSEIFWQLDGQRHVQKEEPYLAVVLRVPKKIKNIKAEGSLIAYHDFDFWGAHLTDWWGDFRPKLQSFFSKGVPLEATAKWEHVLE